MPTATGALIARDRLCHLDSRRWDLDRSARPFEHARVDQSLAKRFRLLYRRELGPNENRVRIIDAPRDAVPGCALLPAGRVGVEDRLPRLVIVNLKVHQHACHGTTPLNSGLREQPKTTDRLGII